MKVSPERFRARLIELRKKQNLTQKTLGETWGCSQQCVQKIESGARRADLDVIAKACAAFGVSADYLIFGNQDNDRHEQL